MNYGGHARTPQGLTFAGQTPKRGVCPILCNAIAQLPMKSSTTGLAENLKRKLRATFRPETLEIVNESHLHAGHQKQFDGRGETHLRIRITSSAFAGMNRLARHRAINALAREEFAAGLHALAIEAKAPGEPA
jgi:BolA protein